MYGSKQNKIDDMLNKIKGVVWELCGVQDVFVYFINEDKKTCTLKIGTGIFANFKLDGILKKYILGQVYENKKIFILDSFSLENLCINNTLKQVACLLILPLMYEDKLFGLSRCCHYESRKSFR
jgi:hypothetical protein